jgi:uncharacterized membrane protein YgdD (TMEM256/DUF423 family)
MQTAQSWIRLLAALSGGLAVAMGAFAAHAATDPHAQELLRTGALYALTHAVAALAIEARSRAAAALFAAGGVVFSLSLYGLAFGAPRLLGAVTPIGGVLMLAGWAAAAWSALGAGSKPHS